MTYLHKLQMSNNKYIYNLSYKYILIKLVSIILW
jgi:starvation-inducible outer membrane lipoprotein